MKSNSDITSVTNVNMQRGIQKAVDFYVSMWDTYHRIAKYGNRPISEIQTTSKDNEEVQE